MVPKVLVIHMLAQVIKLTTMESEKEELDDPVAETEDGFVVDPGTNIHKKMTNKT